MKTLLSNFQGLAALAVAVLLFFFSPMLLRLADPTAGAFDAGYLQRPILGAVYFFFATFCGWLAFQLDYGRINDWLDARGEGSGGSQPSFRRDFDSLTGKERIDVLLRVLAMLFVGFLVCCWLVPV